MVAVVVVVLFGDAVFALVRGARPAMEVLGSALIPGPTAPTAPLAPAATGDVLRAVECCPASKHDSRRSEDEIDEIVPGRPGIAGPAGREQPDHEDDPKGDEGEAGGGCGTDIVPKAHYRYAVAAEYRSRRTGRASLSAPSAPTLDPQTPPSITI
jgi:hypothetical protein